ncbi:MAG TPA: hypothetical protein VKA65_09125 [Acidimicrobiales bacterium]|nr:hypothetical protein [Acidimicrobiales bacterium]
MTGPVTLSPFLALVPASAACADEAAPTIPRATAGRRQAWPPWPAPDDASRVGRTDSEIVLWGDLARVAEIGGIERPAPSPSPSPSPST